MKKTLLAAAMTLAGATAALADPIYGTWKTIPDDNGNYGLINVAACGSKICGTLAKSFNPDGSELQSPNNGRQIIWDMVADGGGKYSGGKLYSPDRDKTYKGKLALNGDKLDVSGCVAVICRNGGTWTRVK